MTQTRDADRDEAWVSVETRAQLSEVRRFCDKVERVFRINPYLEIRSWSEPQPQVYRVELRNLSNGREEKFAMSAARPRQDALLLVYADRLKRSTSIEFERCGRGSRVRITDDYGGRPESDRLARSAEVDRSLTAWGIALGSYLDHERRWGRFSLWYAWLDRVWLPMRPSARRIAFILVAIAIAEIALTVVIVAMIWLQSGSAP